VNVPPRTAHIDRSIAESVASAGRERRLGVGSASVGRFVGRSVRTGWSAVRLAADTPGLARATLGHRLATRIIGGEGWLWR
jgi:hypothetical protein